MSTQKGNVSFKPLSSDSIVEVRTLPPGRSENRLITSSKRRSKPATGFVVDLATTFQVGTLIELDLAFPGQPFTYRARGMVSWISEGVDSNRPHKVWIVVSRMDKLDISGVSMSMPRPDTPPPEPSSAAAAPVDVPEVAAPIDAPQADAPVDAPDDAAPIDAPEVAAPIDAPQADAPIDAPQADAPIDAPQADAPIDAPDDAAQESGEQKTVPKPPNKKKIAELLTNLVGEEVNVTKSDSDSFEQEDFAAVGDYLSDDGVPLALCAVDVQLANWLGAALAMIPKGAVEEDVKKKHFSEEIKENVQEIFNISASVFNKPDAPRHHFNKLHALLEEDIPQNLKELVDSPVDRADYEVEVPGYGTGMICYIVG
ncbi:MAG: hypothetical protein GY847_03700 [Proteobacteria bacterium]|nr:hypothetical protein [Pseudomonadota bacterium]